MTVSSVELARGELERPLIGGDGLDSLQLPHRPHEDGLAARRLADYRDDRPVSVSEMVERRQPWRNLYRALDPEHLGFFGRNGHERRSPNGAFLDDGEQKAEVLASASPRHPAPIQVRKRSMPGRE